MVEWKECLLGDLITFQRGYDLPKSKMSGNGYPVVGSNGIIGFHDEYTTEYPSITVGRSGNVGKPYIVYGQSWSHNTSLYIKDFRDVDPVFIYYFLQTLDLGRYSGGSAVPTLNRNHIHMLNVRVPTDVSTQKTIANILKVLDDKINKNNKINNNLEQQAALLFEENYSNNNYNFAALETVATIKYGKGLPKANLTSVGFPVFGGNGVIGKYSQFMYDKPQVLVSCRGAASGNILESYPYSYITNNSLVLEWNDYRYYEFYKQFLFANPLHSYKTGSAQPQITIDNIRNVLIPYPEYEDVRELCSNLNSIYDLHYKNLVENNKLVALRGTLLPKLMSGEINVSNIDL